MLGLRYAEWATRAPSLEADIAAAAMSLDDLGHSRVLYGCLEPLGEDPRGPDRGADAGRRPPIPPLLRRTVDRVGAIRGRQLCARHRLLGDDRGLRRRVGRSVEAQAPQDAD